MKPVACDRYYELLSARVDRELTRDEAEEVELHLVGCAQCRIVWEQMEEAREAFAHLEEVPAPEGFAQGVMERVRVVESEKKVIPLFKRPQVRALAGLAACLVLVVGLYGASRPRNLDVKGEIMDMTVRGFSRDAASGELEDAPQIAAYAAPEAQGLEKAVPDSPVDTERKLVPPEADVALILDRLPDGAAELIPSGVTVSHDVESGADVYTWLTAAELAAIEALAFEQGLLPGATEGASAPERCALIVQNR